MVFRIALGHVSQKFTSLVTSPASRFMSTFSNTPVVPRMLASKFETKELSTSLEPYTGRSIGNVSNVNAAYRRLNSILAQNNVRRELRANMYYEKPNVARRRKDIERNRKLFGAMVRKKVALIMQMKQRGM